MQEPEKLVSLGLSGHSTAPDSGGTYPANAGGAFAACCDECKAVLANEYFKMQDRMICPACAARLREMRPQQPHAKVRIAVFGIAAALVSCVVAAIGSVILNWTFGVVGIWSGDFIGKSLRAAARRSGSHRRHQVLAVCLTYFSISAGIFPAILIQYTRGPAVRGRTMPFEAQAGTDFPPVPASDRAGAGIVMVIFKYVALGSAVVGVAAFGLLLNPLLFLLIKPLPGVLNLGLIAVGLWRAWKLTAATSEASVSGPFQMDHLRV